MFSPEFKKSSGGFIISSIILGVLACVPLVLFALINMGLVKLPTDLVSVVPEYILRALYIGSVYDYTKWANIAAAMLQVVYFVALIIFFIKGIKIIYSDERHGYTKWQYSMNIKRSVLVIYKLLSGLLGIVIFNAIVYCFVIASRSVCVMSFTELYTFLGETYKILLFHMLGETLVFALGMFFSSMFARPLGPVLISLVFVIVIMGGGVACRFLPVDAIWMYFSPYFYFNAMDIAGGYMQDIIKAAICAGGVVVFSLFSMLIYSNRRLYPVKSE